MATENLAAAPSSEQLKSCVVFLQRGLLEPDSLVHGSKRRRIQLCPFCIVTRSKAIESSDLHASDELSLYLLLTKCRTFLVDAMGFVTTLPSVDDERKIWPDVRRAYNMCSSPSDHIDDPSDEQLFKQLVRSLGATLFNCLHLTWDSSTVPASMRFSTNGAWPTDITDVFPGNSTRSRLTNLLFFWSRHPAMTALVTTVLQLPGISHDASAALMGGRRVFLSTYIRNLTMLGSAVQSLPVGSPQIPQTYRPLSDIVSLGAKVAQVLIAATISPHEFVAGYEDQLSAAFDEVAHAARVASDPDPSIFTLRRVFLTNHRVPLAQGQDATDILRSSQRLADPKEDPYARFYRIASLFSRKSRCSVRGCQRSSELEAPKLMRCARCRAVQYCSRECQRLHWKDELQPHKAACSILARIQDVSPFSVGENDAQAFSVACRGAGIQVEELARPFYHIISAEVRDELPSDIGIKGGSPDLA